MRDTPLFISVRTDGLVRDQVGVERPQLMAFSAQVLIGNSAGMPLRDGMALEAGTVHALDHIDGMGNQRGHAREGDDARLCLAADGLRDGFDDGGRHGGRLVLGARLYLGDGNRLGAGAACAKSSQDDEDTCQR